MEEEQDVKEDGEGAIFGSRTKDNLQLLLLIAPSPFSIIEGFLTNPWK